MKVSIKQYSQTLFDLTDGKSEQEVSVIAGRFVQALQKDGQLKNAGKIMEKFSELYNAAHGIVDAKVVSREKLSDEMLGKLNVFIKEKYAAKEVVISNVVDEKIQGGMVITVGDEVIDASVANKLKRLKKVLNN